MKKLTLLLLTLLLPLVAKADAVEIDGIYYNLIEKAKIAEVTSNPNKYVWVINIPSRVTYNDVEYNVTTIDQLAFSLCYALSSVNIPNSITSIGKGAFGYCSGLTSITIPNSVTSIGEGAFSGCSGLTSITIPNSVTSIGNGAFSGCSGLTSVTIPNSVTSIESYTFSACTNLVSVTIPNSVTIIGYEAFRGCSSLLSITIPNSVTYIGIQAFYDCSRLKTIIIGSGNKTIYIRSFAKCSNLTDVYCLSENVPDTSTDAFNDSYINYATLHVPSASIDAYKAVEPWSGFNTISNLKCATPSISYKNGQLEITCDTEGAEFVTEVTAKDAKKYYEAKIPLTATYTVSAYAIREGFDNSDVATLEIDVRDIGCDVDGNGSVTITDAVKVVNKILENE